MTSPEMPPEILRHYADSFSESDRLGDGVERSRTQELILRYIPTAPAVVLDVGGGPGAYAAWLTDLGYEVHLIDPVPLHVEQAKAIPGLASAEVGDARSLSRPDASTRSTTSRIGPTVSVPCARRIACSGLGAICWRRPSPGSPRQWMVC